MALFFECMPQSAHKVLDTAGIVREAMLAQSAPPLPPATPPGRFGRGNLLRSAPVSRGEGCPAPFAFGVLVRIDHYFCRTTPTIGR